MEQTWPALNALLNAAAAALLIAGFAAIRRDRVRVHRRCMLSAFAVSILFLVSYLAYHAAKRAATGQGHTVYEGEGWLRALYYSVLFTHIPLAALVVPFSVTALVLAWKRRFDRHKAVARWLWPVWMYVSVTGVMVYVLLYVL